MATFELYRRSTIGMCLTENLDEMLVVVGLNGGLRLLHLNWMDQMSQGCKELALLMYKLYLLFSSTQVKSKVTIKGHLHTYRFCDNVWTFILQCSRVKTVKR
ncbi:hypothetical protein F2Q69_00046818, partial [Brassica cretica]